MNTKHTMIPCIVCGVELQRCEDSELQPYEGTMFFSDGNYGSTAFDPMNGEFLTILICDECLKNQANIMHRVAIGREKKPVLIEGSMCGWTYARREPVLWNSEMPNDDNDLRIDTEEEWEVCKDKIILTPGGKALIKSYGWKE